MCVPSISSMFKVLGIYNFGVNWLQYNIDSKQTLNTFKQLELNFICVLLDVVAIVVVVIDN